MAVWTFLDFVDHRGRNLIHDWIEGLPMKARVRLQVQIPILAGLPLLRLPYTRMLEGECDGLFEIRIEVDNVQYRPLAYYGPEKREITILTGATEVGGQLQPPGICATALSRRDLVEQDRRYVCPHDLS
jgi:hypothetical protein